MSEQRSELVHTRVLAERTVDRLILDVEHTNPRELVTRLRDAIWKERYAAHRLREYDLTEDWRRRCENK